VGSLHIHDSKTLTVAISHANSNRNRNKPIKQAVCDRGYVGANIILPYLWVVVLIPVGRTRSLFDKFQTGCAWEVCVAIL
jgi:hypothetical protein